MCAPIYTTQNNIEELTLLQTLIKLGIIHFNLSIVVLDFHFTDY
jgi:hypothetical protein